MVAASPNLSSLSATRTGKLSGPPGADVDDRRASCTGAEATCDNTSVVPRHSAQGPSSQCWNRRQLEPQADERRPRPALRPARPQNGLIDRQLVAAFQASGTSPGRPGRSTVVRGSPLTDARTARGPRRRAPQEAWRRRPRRAWPPSARRVHAREPGPDRRSRRGLARPAGTRRHRPRPARQTRDRTASYAVGTATADGQRFRVLRPHARGGLGAVFVALDTELHREVALKQILDHHADDPTSRQRFLLEAEITGGLEHPGIVPVYGLGTYGDGRPYYAMRFIKGDSLKEAIERFHADEALEGRPRPAVAGAAQAAAAVHRRLQRDRLRPQPRRAAPRHQAGQHHRRQARRDAGRGLGPGQGRRAGPSRRRHRTSGRSCPSSASGIGRDAARARRWARPAYMSPEQAGGDLDRLGPRSDVYSLGATLYCLLTGRPPFEGDDIGDVLRRPCSGATSAAPQARPDDRPALEAVCLKAMALEPEDRYAIVPGAGRGHRALDGRRAGLGLRRAAGPHPAPLARRGTARGVAAAAVAAGGRGRSALGAVAAVQTRPDAVLDREESRSDRGQHRARPSAAAAPNVAEAIDAVKTFRDAVTENPSSRATRTREPSQEASARPLAFFQELRSGSRPTRTRGPRQRLARCGDPAIGKAHGRDRRQQDGLTAYQECQAILGADRARTPNHRIPARAGPRQDGRALQRDRQAGRGAGVRSSRRGRSGSGWHGITPPSPRSGATWPRATTTSACCSPPPASRPRRWRRTSGPGRSSSDWRENPTVTEFQSDLATSHNNIGNLLRDTGKPAEALAATSGAVDPRAAGAGEPHGHRVPEPPGPEPQQHRRLHSDTGKPAEALAAYEKRGRSGSGCAGQPHRHRLPERPGPEPQQHRHAAQRDRQAGRGMTAYEQARTIRERLAIDNPTVTNSSVSWP